MVIVNSIHSKKKCFHVCLQECDIKKASTPEDIEQVVVDLEEVLYIQDGSLVVIHCKNITPDIIDVAYYIGACIYCEEFKIDSSSIGIIDYLCNRTVPIFWKLEDLAIYIERYYKLKQIKTHNDLIQFAPKVDCTPHFCNVSKLSSAIATKLGCDNNTSQLITDAALIHDFGKIALPHSFLNSPKWFNKMERRFASLHVLYGYNLLKDLNTSDSNGIFARLCQDVVLYHHERHDGSGYPIGKNGNTIPLSVKIVAVADVYDAIRSHRPYRSACDHELAISFLKANKEKFAPEIVRALEDVTKNGTHNSTCQLRVSSSQGEIWDVMNQLPHELTFK